MPKCKKNVKNVSHKQKMNRPHIAQQLRQLQKQATKVFAVHVTDTEVELAFHTFCTRFYMLQEHLRILSRQTATMLRQQQFNNDDFKHKFKKLQAAYAVKTLADTQQTVKTYIVSRKMTVRDVLAEVRNLPADMSKAIALVPEFLSSAQPEYVKWAQFQTALNTPAAVHTQLNMQHWTLGKLIKQVRARKSQRQRVFEAIVAHVEQYFEQIRLMRELIFMHAHAFYAFFTSYQEQLMAQGLTQTQQQIVYTNVGSAVQTMQNHADEWLKVRDLLGKLKNKLRRSSNNNKRFGTWCARSVECTSIAGLNSVLPPLLASTVLPHVYQLFLKWMHEHQDISFPSNKKACKQLVLFKTNFHGLYYAAHQLYMEKKEEERALQSAEAPITKPNKRKHTQVAGVGTGGSGGSGAGGGGAKTSVVAVATVDDNLTRLHQYVDHPCQCARCAYLPKTLLPTMMVGHFDNYTVRAAIFLARFTQMDVQYLADTFGIRKAALVQYAHLSLCPNNAIFGFYFPPMHTGNYAVTKVPRVAIRCLRQFAASNISPMVAYSPFTQESFLCACRYCQRKRPQLAQQCGNLLQHPATASVWRHRYAETLQQYLAKTIAFPHAQKHRTFI
ncbi:hypothetical protein OAM67_00760 [bacterium]|nr:hypothetical protein [bacterium]